PTAGDNVLAIRRKGHGTDGCLMAVVSAANFSTGCHVPEMHRLVPPNPCPVTCPSTSRGQHLAVRRKRQREGVAAAVAAAQLLARGGVPKTGRPAIAACGQNLAVRREGGGGDGLSLLDRPLPHLFACCHVPQAGETLRRHSLIPNPKRSIGREQ